MHTFAYVAKNGSMYTDYVRTCRDLALDRVEFAGRLTTEEELTAFYRGIHCGISPYRSARPQKADQADFLKMADYVANYRFVLMTSRMPGTDMARDQGLGQYVAEDPREIARTLLEMPGKLMDGAAADVYLEDRYQIFRETMCL